MTTTKQQLRVKYNGKGGASVENNHGTWNVGAPEIDPRTGKAHPASPIKEMDVDKAIVLSTTGLFEIVDEDVIE